MLVEAYQVIRKIKKVYTLLCCIFNILKAKLRNNTNNKVILQIAVKALNNTARLDSIILTLLIFKAYLRINIDSSLLLDIMQYTTAVYKAIKNIQAKRARKDINYAINIQNSLVIYNILNAS